MNILCWDETCPEQISSLAEELGVRIKPQTLPKKKRRERGERKRERKKRKEESKEKGSGTSLSKNT